MIFVSSACVKAKTIKEAIEILYTEGFKNIELSGGTSFYPTIEQDLISFKEKYDVEFILHNYFPPPHKDFVLNIASLDDEIYYTSINHIKKAIDISKKLEILKFAFHAGFLLDIPVSQIGKKIQKFTLFTHQGAMQRFCEAYKVLQEHAGDNFSLYIENNVLSAANADTYQPQNPFFLTNQKNYEELSAKIDFNLLLDVAHLKVSANSLKLDFTQELQNLYQFSDYIHISDNDGTADTNKSLKKDSLLYQELKKLDWQNKTITLEVYEGMESLKESYTNMESLTK